MILYGDKNAGGTYYCDNDLNFTELFPVSLMKKSFTAENPAHFWTRNSYAVLFLNSGYVHVTNSRLSATLTDDCFIILDPFSSLNVMPISDADYFLLQFSGSRANDFLPFVGDVHCREGLFDELSSLLAQNNRHDVYFVSFLFRLYGILGIQNSTSSERSKLNPYVKMIIDNIDNSFSQRQYLLENVAHDLGINPKYMSRLFKKEVGITMQEYLKRKRLASAYELLSMGHKVKYAALRSGIGDTSNFSDMFKKYYGIRPSEVKKQKTHGIAVESVPPDGEAL